MDSYRNGRSVTLSIPCKNKHLIQDLLDAEADVNQEVIDYGGEMIYDHGPATPLLLTIRDHDISLVRHLINAGADLKHPRIATSTIFTENKQIVKTLLEARAVSTILPHLGVDGLHCN